MAKEVNMLDELCAVGNTITMVVKVIDKAKMIEALATMYYPEKAEGLGFTVQTHTNYDTDAARDIKDRRIAMEDERHVNEIKAINDVPLRQFLTPTTPERLMIPRAIQNGGLAAMIESGEVVTKDPIVAEETSTPIPFLEKEIGARFIVDHPNYNNNSWMILRPMTKIGLRGLGRGYVTRLLDNWPKIDVSKPFKNGEGTISIGDVFASDMDHPMNINSDDNSAGIEYYVVLEYRCNIDDPTNIKLPKFDLGDYDKIKMLKNISPDELNGLSGFVVHPMDDLTTIPHWDTRFSSDSGIGIGDVVMNIYHDTDRVEEEYFIVVDWLGEEDTHTPEQVLGNLPRIRDVMSIHDSQALKGLRRICQNGTDRMRREFVVHISGDAPNLPFTGVDNLFITESDKENVSIGDIVSMTPGGALTYFSVVEYISTGGIDVGSELPPFIREFEPEVDAGISKVIRSVQLQDLNTNPQGYVIHEYNSLMPNIGAEFMCENGLALGDVVVTDRFSDEEEYFQVIAWDGAK